ncbi:MAG TPA: hypothetical protein VJY63_00510 [Marinospirillum sp.]|uniref:hypothetical protein n=1 Tax=Marinospirillum sp. TaxID=2183934 RepID=UPI002B46AC4C|nr:hypothetical protein [Marinospirillum sp.]HKM14392.1 hypothetical protein [Marinospirillum sp.]
MDNLITLSWLAYCVSSFFFMLASWKLLFWLPFTLKVGVFLSQLAILLIPADVNEAAVAPAFIVLVIDLLSHLAIDEVIVKIAPLFATLVLVWPLAFILGWLRARQLNLAVQKEAVNKDVEAY